MTSIGMKVINGIFSSSNWKSSYGKGIQFVSLSGALEDDLETKIWIDKVPLILEIVVLIFVDYVVDGAYSRDNSWLS